MNTDYDYAESLWVSDFRFDHERDPRWDEYEVYYQEWWKTFKEEQAADAAVAEYEERRDER